MNFQFIRIFLNLLGIVSVTYSFLTLSSLAVKTGGFCNAGVIFFGIGLFLIVCSTLTIYSIYITLKLLPKKEISIKSIILSTLSLIIWGFWMFMISIDESFDIYIYFIPILITNGITILYSIKPFFKSN